MGQVKKRGKAGRPQKTAEAKMQQSIRIRVTEADKAKYERAAHADGFGQVSAWFRHCAIERMARLRQEEKLPPDVMIGVREPRKP